MTRFTICGASFELALRRRDWQVYVGRHGNNDWHESQISGIFSSLACRASRVFDVGAHVGWYTCLSSVLQPKAYVTAFEMHSANVAILRRNIALNSLARATAVHAAVCDLHNREVAYSVARSSLEHTLDVTSEMPTKTVKSISIDGWCQETGHGPDLVKIDVENAEASVLNGMTLTLSEYRPNLVVEVHTRSSSLRCKSILEANGYRVQTLRAGHGILVAQCDTRVGRPA